MFGFRPTIVYCATMLKDIVEADVSIRSTRSVYAYGEQIVILL